MLFQKNIEPRCAYCKKGISLDDEQILCSRKGVVNPGGACRRFRYDPLKRVPKKPITVNFSHLKEEDFKL